MVEINKQAPSFEEEAYINGKTKKISLQDYHNKWVILFFYPADFTFVCPTELGELADHYETFKKLNTEIISVSTDTAFVHKAWHDHSPTIKKIQFPMLADPARRVCEAYKTLIPHDGLSLRATFIIDPQGIVKSIEMNDNSIGRSVEELLRKLQAAQYVAEHDGEVCPMNWKPGQKTLKPGMDLVGKI
ncbi:MAG: alkyl hydroperoxide reductase subunit C [Candidatus Woesearchaeota archaeon]